MAIAYIGLGTNLGDRRANIERARRMMAERELLAVTGASSVEETEPVDVTDQPRFLNTVVRGTTKLAPGDLYAGLSRIEADMGRVRVIPRGPRIIDLDILLYDVMVIKTADLEIPHPRIKQRVFVMKHLLEIEPDLTDPATGEPYREVLLRWRG
ncbi:MAG: 2-amino-4-hydroxy-6-hydroxymethyldihydropteridine diphosphokinase [Spirochaetes bacterium]|nr:2-amino-4-hydroxy-6-hydroxymethyldihydropteridine diphosphokinase [Spirochaetota bacterium]